MFELYFGFNMKCVQMSRITTTTTMMMMRAMKMFTLSRLQIKSMFTDRIKRKRLQNGKNPIPNLVLNQTKTVLVVLQCQIWETIFKELTIQ